MLIATGHQVTLKGLLGSDPLPGERGMEAAAGQLPCEPRSQHHGEGLLLSQFLKTGVGLDPGETTLLLPPSLGIRTLRTERDVADSGIAPRCPAIAKSEH